tara:strand:- start:2090 stop:3127 length:1038 start_codon:yes stop_codon:yes gene_type:complete
MEINGRKIGKDYSPYIVAELSANHNGSLKKAKQIIKSAKDNGADAIKIQTYTADSMTIDSEKEDFQVKGGLWDGYKLYDLYKEASTPYAWHEELFKYAKEIDFTIFSSPFDEEAVELLESLNTPAYKIASFELTDLPLIEYIANKNKPLLISTGMGSKSEIKEAVETAKMGGCKEILLFHCISSYPTPTKESNLSILKQIQSEFEVEVGLSDHTLNNTAAIASVALGAVAIEKHFTLDRGEKGPDSEFSIEPKELKNLKEQTKDCWEALGSNKSSRPNIEDKNKAFRRSLYFIKDLKQGDLITENDIRRIRPGFGLPPKMLSKVLSKRTKVDVEKGDRVRWEIIE